MTISGFSFVRNGIKFDYPFLESIQSILPLCDDFVIAVGKSDDDTLKKIQSLHTPKIKIIETTWNEELRSGGTILAQQTNIALQQVTGDWAFYLQADEVIHEKDLPVIHDAMRRYREDQTVEGLLFEYRHFFGGYGYIGASRRWYRREIRAFKTGLGAQSWADAQGFRIRGRKLRVKQVDACIHHYGWVKPPRIQQLKQRNFHKFWHPDNWLEKHVGGESEFDYSNGGKLVPFQGSHPSVMKDRIQQENWQFRYDPSKLRQPFKERLLDALEEKTGHRLGEYKNYEIV